MLMWVCVMSQICISHFIYIYLCISWFNSLLHNCSWKKCCVILFYFLL
jgi:hypothetical protein